MNKKFSKVSEKAPRPGRKEKGSLFSESPEYQFKTNSADVDEQISKPGKKDYKTLTIRDVDEDLLNVIKNIVYTEKINGNICTTNSSIAIQALQQFAKNYPRTICERPQEIKAVEIKRGIRRKK